MFVDPVLRRKADWFFGGEGGEIPGFEVPVDRLVRISAVQNRKEQIHRNQLGQRLRRHQFFDPC